MLRGSDTDQRGGGAAMIVSGVQMAPAFMDKQANLSAIGRWIERAARDNADLVVFPECALTGFGVESRDEAVATAEAVPGPASESIAGVCARTGCYAIVGLIEREGQRLYNSAIIVGPEGVVGRHRKAHLGPVGVDAYVDRGQALDVHRVCGACVGILICYECRFPEAARVLAMKGAQILVIAANHPTGSEVNLRILSPARAVENRVYVLHCNRTGSERGFTYVGQSVFYDPDGMALAVASTDECSIVTSIDAVRGGLGKVVTAKSGIALDLRQDRRPELYKTLTE